MLIQRITFIPLKAKFVKFCFAFRSDFYTCPPALPVYSGMPLQPFAKWETIFINIGIINIYISVLLVVGFGLSVTVLPLFGEGILPVHAYGVKALYLLLRKLLRAFYSSVSGFAHPSYPRAYS